jgi:AmmeMemoRadiSam system protein A
MSILTDKDRNTLLKLARSTITAKLANDPEPKRPGVVSSALKQAHGCFVSLHKRGALRGCIGTIEPLKPLITCVEENALNAAFRDSRFPPLKKDELADIELEISVLTVPKVLAHKDSQDLLDKLKPGIHGVIISQGGCRATFLPQVWEQLPEKEAFLENLCRKGCLDRKAWRDKKSIVEVYEVEYFSETK